MYDWCHRRQKYDGVYKDMLGYVNMSEEVHLKHVELVANTLFCIAVKILVVK